MKLSTRSWIISAVVIVIVLIIMTVVWRKYYTELYHAQYRAPCAGLKDAFFDDGSCWSCPSGMRDDPLISITNPKACTAADPIYLGAISDGAMKYCSHYNGVPGPGGNCWKCPPTTKRDALNVCVSEDPSAQCAKHGGTPDLSGTCSRCPKYMGRDLLVPLSSDLACKVPPFNRDKYCTMWGHPNAFADPNGGCYMCDKDAGWIRTWMFPAPITGDQACTRFKDGKVEFSPSTNIKKDWRTHAEVTGIWKTPATVSGSWVSPATNLGGN